MKKTLVGFFAALAASVALAQVELWKAGDFANPRGGARVEDSPEGKTLVIPKPGAYLARTFWLKPEWRVIKLKGKMKVTDVPRCAQSWQTGRFAMEWKDAKGKTVTPWPENRGWTGTTDWIEVDVDQLVPSNAVQLSISLCNLSTGGEVRFRDVLMAVIRNRVTEPGNAPLPKGATADAESLDGAWRETTGTRSRFSLNGLWRCRPSLEGEDAGFVPGPADNWAWEQVPNVWPEPKKSPFAASEQLAPWFEDHPADMARIRPDRAWYGRTVTLPASAEGKRVSMTFDVVASRAVVYLDGVRAGEASYPGGEVDLSPLVKPGRPQSLAIDVTAYQDGETLVYNEARRSDKVKNVVKLKGVTGDVWLDIGPKGARVVDAWVETSVSRGEATFVAETAGLAPGTACRLAATVAEPDGSGARTFAGESVADAHGKVSFTAPWRDAKLWDVHTPRNVYTCRLALADSQGRVLDEAVPFSFGFREARISGRDLLLNGTVVHLRALHDPSPNCTGFTMSRVGGLAFCRNVRAYGFNSFISGNYSFGAGSTSYLQGMLEACDEEGMLYCFTLPHFKDFGDMSRPEAQERYRKTTAWLMRLARKHPSVVMWATSHNATGYLAAGDPLLIDGVYEYDGNAKNRGYGRICRRIIGELDGTRPCYHHESGNLDDFHCVNCYLDWSPVQERSDWLEHWSTKGVKPLFFVEWGLPHISTWSSYRGPLFIWRKPGYMSLWSAEYAAAYRNDAAYEATPEIRAALDAEENAWLKPRAFYWGRELTRHCQAISNNYVGVQALFASDNWRSFRGWGITAVLPWDQGGICRRVLWTTGTANPDWPSNLKRPGFLPKTLVPHWADEKEYVPTALGVAMKRWNMPDCAWIGGGEAFTGKRHVYRPGETVEKTLIVVNDRRTVQKVVWEAECGNFASKGEVSVAPGAQARVPISFPAPGKAGVHALRVKFAFADGVAQRDEFSLSVRIPAAAPKETVTLLDTAGETAKELKRLGVAFRPFEHGRLDPAKSLLVVGRNSLTGDSYRRTVLPFALSGGRALVFEQRQNVLEDIGFRVQVLGMRHVYPRFREDALADVLSEENLRDWAGASTLVATHYSHTDRENYRWGTGSDLWAGYRNQRVWRCGNRGTVATVVPEKPSYGDWCALADGGFDLQYAPLLEWRTLSRGKVVFCQLDVTARTAADPAADDIVRRLVAALPLRPPAATIASPHGMQAYASVIWSPRDRWTIEHDPDKDSRRLYYITGGAQVPEGFLDNIKNGGTALLCGLDAEEVRRFSPVPLAVADTNRCHYTRIEKLPPELNGLSNADWAWHGAMDFAAFTDEVPDGNNALRVVRHGKGRLVFWQVPPWKIDATARPYLRTSKRRAEAMLSRLMGNLGFRSGSNASHLYADVPVAEDDPYRYFHW